VGEQGPRKDATGTVGNINRDVWYRRSVVDQRASQRWACHALGFGRGSGEQKRLWEARKCASQRHATRSTMMACSGSLGSLEKSFPQATGGLRGATAGFNGHGCCSHCAVAPTYWPPAGCPQQGMTCRGWMARAQQPMRRLQYV
jgi:hypothetical protein